MVARQTLVSGGDFSGGLGDTIRGLPVIFDDDEAKEAAVPCFEVQVINYSIGAISSDQ